MQVFSSLFIIMHLLNLFKNKFSSEQQERNEEEGDDNLKYKKVSGRVVPLWLRKEEGKS